MTITLNTIVYWLAHCALGGGLILLITYFLMRLPKQPALKQRIGEIGLIAALIVPVLTLLPAWFILGWPQQTESVIQKVPKAKIPKKFVAPPNKSPQQIRVTIPRFPSEANEKPEVTETEKPKKAPLVTKDSANTKNKPSSGNKKGPPVQTPLPEDCEPFVQNDPELEEEEEDPQPAVAIQGGWFFPIILSLYLLGSGFCFLRLFGAFLLLSRLVRQARPVPNRVQERLRKMIKGKDIPRLLMSDRLRYPLSFGLWTPTIVLPTALCEDSSPDRIDWVLTHELTHISRKDAWSGLLGSLVQAMFFYLPWVLWIRRQVQLCQEYVADAATVPQESHKADYAEFLLSLTRAAGVPALAASVSGSSSELSRRIRMLLEKPVNIQQRCSRKWLSMATVGLFALAIFVSGFGVRSIKAQTIIIVEDAGNGPMNVKKWKTKEAQLFLLPNPKAGIHKKILIFKRAMPGIEVDVDVRKLKNVPAANVKAIRLQGQNGINWLNPNVDVTIIPAGKIHTNPHQPQFKVVQVQVPNAPKLPVPPGIDAKAWNDLQNALEKLKGAEGKKEIEAVRKEIQTAITKLNAKVKFLPKTLDLFVQKGIHPVHGRSRLGIHIEPPSELLAAQLGLPKGTGIVVSQVVKGSVADKAGIKKHDIVVKLNKQSVPNDAGKVIQMVAGLKAKKPFDVVVLRKGKETVIKGVELPEVPKINAKFKVIPFNPNLPNFPPQFVPNAPFPPVPNGPGIMMSTYRNNNRFTSRYQEGSLVITITGPVNKGKAEPKKIIVQDGQKRTEYTDAKKVPDQYRDKVNDVIRMIQTGQVVIQNPKKNAN